jgi:hypothetical protein
LRHSLDVEFSNIGDPFPEGRVDNLAPSPVGVSLPEHGTLGSTPVPAPDDRGVYVAVQWGPEQWKENTRGCVDTRQIFDVLPAAGYIPSPDGKVYPAIVYFHENGATQSWEFTSKLHENVVQEAHSKGFHFISVEFRHPVSNQYLNDDPLPNFIPHTDAGKFIQFLRKNREKLKLDDRNIFVFGRSRGAIALWQGLQPDLGSGPTSSAIRAFVGYQAQTTYQCRRFSENFFIQDDRAKVEEAKCLAENTHDRHFGNAVDSVNASTSLPVRLQYEKYFVAENGRDGRVARLPADELVANFDTLHYPNFGLALYYKYEDTGANSQAPNGKGKWMERPEDGILKKDQFKNWWGFVNTWRVQ